MRIAILGAGFSGIATAWHLLNKIKTPVHVVVFDPAGVGGGASGIAAGLMHPFAGAHAKLNWMGREGYDATCKLLAVASQTIGKPVADFLGILRIAVTDEQKQDFATCSAKFHDVQQLSDNSFLIRTGALVNSSLYLKGLWQACEQRGAHLEQTAIRNLEELQEFDQIIIAIGAASKQFADIPVTAVKGQILHLSRPFDMPLLTYPINSHAYIANHPDAPGFLAGSTYERDFSSIDPNPAVAIADIMPKLKSLLPQIEHAQLLDCKAGIRASTPDHRPIVHQIRPRVWVITGMGSKGLLYHALFAEKLVNDLLQENYM